MSRDERSDKNSEGSFQRHPGGVWNFSRVMKEAGNRASTNRTIMMISQAAAFHTITFVSVVLPLRRSVQEKTPTFENLSPLSASFSSSIRTAHLGVPCSILRERFSPGISDGHWKAYFYSTSHKRKKPQNCSAVVFEECFCGNFRSLF